MPNELLRDMEDEIVNAYIKELVSLIKDSGAMTDTVCKCIEDAKSSYERMYN